MHFQHKTNLGGWRHFLEFFLKVKVFYLTLKKTYSEVIFILQDILLFRKFKCHCLNASEKCMQPKKLLFPLEQILN